MRCFTLLSWRLGLQLLALSVLSMGQAAAAPDHFTAVSAAANPPVDSPASLPLSVTNAPSQTQSKPSPANVGDQHDTDCEPEDFSQYADLSEFDLTELVAGILKELGGAPGKVNVTRRPADSVPMFTAGEPDSHYDTTDRAYWLYKYGATDWRTYVRVEHALLRNDKLAGQYEDVYGELWWSAPGLCGQLLHAKYYPDDRIRDVMHAELKLELCRINVAPDAPLSSATFDCSEYEKVYGPGGSYSYQYRVKTASYLGLISLPLLISLVG